MSSPAASWSRTGVKARAARWGTGFGASAPRAPAARELVSAAEFTERKAVDLLMAAWDAAREAGHVDGWRLRMLGWRPRTSQVLTWGRGREDVEVVVAADRAHVHDALRRAAVVVLPSRRVDGWREQVGLSLAEGLAHGCHLLTTTETGLAEGLRADGHTVVPPEDARALAQGLRRATGVAPLLRPVPPAALDSRRRVLDWLAGDGGVPLPAPARRYPRTSRSATSPVTTA